MKPITFENLRRLMGGGRKKKDKDGGSSSFKRSDSFKRISIRKSYLDRGKKKAIPKLEVATQTVSEEELLEEAVKKVDSCVQADLSATPPTDYYRTSGSPEAKRGDSVVVYSQWLQEIKREEPPKIKGSERTVIYVPAFDEKPQRAPVIRRLSSSPAFRKKNTSSVTHICHGPPMNVLQRKESNDSAVEMFPWGDSTEVKKSPLIVKRRSRQQSPVTPLLPTDSEEMCSLSISLGRIWMDAPQAMTPRSLEMPKSSSCSSNNPPAHNSLDSALKDLRDDPIVSNRLQRRPTPPAVARTLSSTSNNTNSTGLFSSKDSGFSFSISAPKLTDFHAKFSPNGGGSKGFFRKKSRPKPKLSVSRDGYFKRTSSAVLVETRRASLRRRSSKKKKRKAKKMEKDSSTIRSDIYQVICSRPQRAVQSLKLDPMIFVPPEKRKSAGQKPSFKTRMQEIRHFNPLDSSMYSSSTTVRSVDSTDEGLYESLPGDHEYLTDDEEINLESFSMERKDLRQARIVSSGYGVVRKFCGREEPPPPPPPPPDPIRPKHEKEETRRYRKGHGCTTNKNSRGLDNFLEEEDSLTDDVASDESGSGSEGRAGHGVYVPPGVSPVPRRRPVRRKKSAATTATGLTHKRSVTYLVKPTVIRAPSTLRRPAKKSGKKSKQQPQPSRARDSEGNCSHLEDNSHEP